MAQRLSVFGAAIVADAAGLATELGGGATTAEFTALGNLLIVLGARNDIAAECLKVLSATDIVELQPT
jgi:hypothetical protein